MAARCASWPGAFHERDVISRFAPSRSPRNRRCCNLRLPAVRPLRHRRRAAPPFAWGGPARATVQMKVPVVDDTGAGSTPQMTVHVYGPADVTELDPRQVIRILPKADVDNAEIDDLVQIEFDRPDLPWLFTPAGPTPTAGSCRGSPWSWSSGT